MARKMDIKEFENFRGWIPVRCFRQENEAFVDWCFLGNERLTEPFFDDSILKRFREPFNLLFRHQTSIDFLGELNDLSKGLKPSGFIFHLSRCGSTLVSQMLAALERNIVISEASPLDFVLRAAEIPEKTRIKWLQWMVNALGQQRNPLEENFFIKFDSWNTLELQLIKRAFPDVPWIFLYRNPVEVIVSHIRQRGAHMIPGLIPGLLPELSFDESIRISPEEFCAQILGKVCRSALDSLKNGAGLAVNYAELPEAVESKILNHFKVQTSPEDLEKMLSTTKFNAKNPGMDFSADTEKKRKEASAEAVRAAEKYVVPVYEELENVRKNAQKTSL
jgi:hypothetical protein